MSKKLTDVQVIDLGSHIIKFVALSNKSGKPTVERSGFVTLTDSFSDATRYFGDVRNAIDGLANSAIIDKKSPLFFVVGEGLMPISVNYLNNQKTVGVELALEDSLNKFVAAEGTSALEVTLRKSFKLREKPQGGDVQIVAAHTYIKYDYIKEMQEICLSRKIPFGGAFPKLFAYQEVFKHSFAGNPAVLNAITVLIDLGYHSTNLVAFKEGRIVFWKSLHMGARDYFNELRNLSAEKNFFQLTFPQFTDYMVKVGLTGETERIAELGLPIANPANYLETTDSITEELCTKVRLSLDYFSTVSATDFNTSMATVMAVRKGAEYSYLMGGVVACQGFQERAREQLTDAVQTLDPMAAIGGTPQGLPTMHFAVAVGGALAAFADESDDCNIGLLLEGTQSSGTRSDAAQSVLDDLPKWAHGILLLVVLFLAVQYWMATSTCKKLLARKQTVATELGAAVEFFPKLANSRRTNAANFIKLEFYGEVASARPRWAALLKELSETSQDLVKLTRVQAEVVYPRFNGQKGAEGAFIGTREPMKVQFKLAGQAKTRDAVFSFSRKLTEKGHFTDLEQPALAEVSAGMNPFAAEESGGPAPAAQFYFQLTGNLKRP